eukprot:TRINITY_DN9283_c2_g1_i1.p1 TRINITY_DN9283_c2_g1~~TRINITY_DN9283_c2_g1_i1.p1  ORF type:complete len:128 (-),score=18.65 TRINITY_DN9283_c2_g1_i1:704-1087(-)
MPNQNTVTKRKRPKEKIYLSLAYPKSLQCISPPAGKVELNMNERREKRIQSHSYGTETSREKIQEIAFTKPLSTIVMQHERQRTSQMAKNSNSLDSKVPKCLLENTTNTRPSLLQSTLSIAAGPGFH